MPDYTETPDQELARLRRRVAELETELAARPPGLVGACHGAASGNLTSLALRLLAAEAAVIFVSTLVAGWCREGHQAETGWAELGYVAGLVFCLAAPLSVCALNVLIMNLWALATGPRLLIAGSLSVASIWAVALQWWWGEMDELAAFAAGALCLLFLPATGLRLLTRWRIRPADDAFGEQHAAPRTFDLMLLTVVLALGISIIRWHFGVRELELTSGYLWWLAAINSLLPGAVVCLGGYFSLRALLGPARLIWLPAAVLTNLLAGVVFMLQNASDAFTTWPPPGWTRIISVPVDLAILAFAIGAALTGAPLLILRVSNLESR